MAKCKFCGQGVRTAPVFHPACWEQRANKVMEEFCDEYCRFPREIEDHDDLIEHCSECVVAELLRMGGNGMMLELTGKDILALTNESKRKNILAAWRSWGIWHKAPEIGLSVYRLDLPDGSFFTASWYEGDDFFPGGGTHNVNRPRFNLCDKGGKLKAGSKAESLLTDKLKELRKELLERESNGHA